MGTDRAPRMEPRCISMFCTNRRSERGNAVIEFALAWSLLWVLFAGVYQYGYSFYVYNRLMTAVANAAELGSKINYDIANPGAFTTILQNMVLYGDEIAGSTPIVSGLTAAHVNVSVTTTGTSSTPSDVTITIGSVAAPFPINGFFGTISLTGKPRATVKYFG